MRELINESAKLFNTSTSDKWNAFLELINISREIQRGWFEKFQSEMIKYFNREQKAPRWSITSDGGLIYIWFLEDFSRNSISLWLEGFGLNLWVNQGNHDISIINELLTKEEYKPLFLSFGPRAQRIPPPNNYLFMEKVNWDLGSPYDGNFDEQHLAWYAGNEPEKLVSQIAKKINPFFTEEITTLLYELNKKSLRQKI